MKKTQSKIVNACFSGRISRYLAPTINNQVMEEEKYGINFDEAHATAKALIPEDFFWNNMDELAPFGSDEGDTALAEFRDWRKRNPQLPTIHCLQWVR